VAEEGFRIVDDAPSVAPMAMVQVRGRPDSSMLDEPRGVWHVAIVAGRPVPMAQAKVELNALNEAYKKSEPRANQRHTINLAQWEILAPCARRSRSSVFCCADRALRSPAAMSRVCCWRERRRGGAKWQRGSRSAPAAVN
jgi:hypothetical protein